MIAVTGSTGQLGTAFATLLGDEARYLPRDDLDLADISSIEPLLKRLAPSQLINCAAYTAVDRAEDEHELAFEINAVAVEEMARVCGQLGARFVTFSTDYVFDGTSDAPYVESSPTNPINAYGRSKLTGEGLALAANPDCLIIRTSWVLSGTHPNFAETMIRRAPQGDLRVVNDQRGRPTLVADLAPATLRALEVGASGILHLTNQGVATWYELARQVLQLAGLDPGLISGCSTDDYPRPAARPANSVLDSERLEVLGLDPMPGYQPGLEKAVAQIVSRMKSGR